MQSTRSVETGDTYRIGLQAITYTYPLFEMLRMRGMTAARRNARGDFADADTQGMRRWVNTFTHARRLLKAGESRVVTPNNDTLYSTTWLDLSQGPRVLSVPDTQDRYYVLGFLDAYTNPFCHIGRRTTGTAAGQFLLTGPGWTGTVPAGMQRVECPTPMVWVIGRILVEGPQDVAPVNALQDGFTLAALDGGDGAGNIIDTWMAHRQLPDDVMEYLRTMRRGMQENPPPATEAALMTDFARIGLGPQAAADDLESLSPTQRQELAQAYEYARSQLGHKLDQPGTASWAQPFMLGETFGDDYQMRADVAHGYIGALCSAEAMYPMAHHDAQGQALHGANRYRLRFGPGQLPPVDCFWSITMYNKQDFMLVPNPIDRYAIGDRSHDLRRDPDGSLELCIQHEPPTDGRVNWLPAPEGEFYLCLRAYQPRAELLEGRYQPPNIERLA